MGNIVIAAALSDVEVVSTLANMCSNDDYHENVIIDHDTNIDPRTHNNSKVYIHFSLSSDLTDITQEEWADKIWLSMAHWLEENHCTIKYKSRAEHSLVWTSPDDPVLQTMTLTPEQAVVSKVSLVCDSATGWHFMLNSGDHQPRRICKIRRASYAAYRAKKRPAPTSADDTKASFDALKLAIHHGRADTYVKTTLETLYRRLSALPSNVVKKMGGAIGMSYPNVAFPVSKFWNLYCMRVTECMLENFYTAVHEEKYSILPEDIPDENPGFNV